MDDLLPAKVLDRFGKVEMTALNGDFTFLDPADLPAIQELLERLGYVVKDGSYLGEWH